MKESTGHTPFSLVYGTETVLPMETVVHTVRTANFDPITNEEAMLHSLDLVKETRDSASHNLAVYRGRMEKTYNKRVQTRFLYQGDLVLRKSAATDKGNLHEKLSTRWEGSYLIKETKGPNTYILETLDGSTLPSYWNTDQLKKFYP